MSTAELKNILHRFVVETEDTSILKKVMTIFKEGAGKEDWWNGLDEQDKKSIEKGITDIKDGRTHKDKDVRSQIRARILNAQSK